MALVVAVIPGRNLERGKMVGSLNSIKTLVAVSESSSLAISLMAPVFRGTNYLAAAGASCPK
jgi:hypothetical protein